MDQNNDDVEQTIYHRLHNWLLRILAILVMLFAIFYWARLIGWQNIENWRFDLMTLPWKLVAITGAVIGPIASMGLWLLASWGLALWFGLALMHIVLFAFTKQWFEPNYELVGAIILSMLCYAVLRVRILLLSRD